MFRTGIRRFATSAIRRAEVTAAQMEANNQYGVKISQTQGVVKGLTGGLSPLTRSSTLFCSLLESETSIEQMLTTAFVQQSVILL
jgi:hypothetical protein